MNFEEWESQAEYTQLNNFMSCGTNIQVSGLMFPYNVHVTERTYFWWNFLKDSTTHWVLDLVIPETEKKTIEDFGGTFATQYYTDDGYGMPQFDDLEKAFNYNEHYARSISQIRMDNRRKHCL